MRIDSYDFGRIVVGGKAYNKDLIIFLDHVFSPWWRKEGHYLDVIDLPADLLAEDPEEVVIGSGYSGLMKVSPKVKELFKSIGINPIIGNTIDVWYSYNNLSQTKKVIALFHLTC